MTLAFYRSAAAKRCQGISTPPQLILLRAYIERTLPDSPRLNVAAAALHMSSRSLQRYLQASNSSFRHLVNECRHRLAKQYLREKMQSIQEIATQLGFEEQSSFQKAFKSWQGCSPGVYRQRSNTKISRAYPGYTMASRRVMYGSN